MNNDLSDEAFELWARDTFELRAHKPTWQECRRRALEKKLTDHSFNELAEALDSVIEDRLLLIFSRVTASKLQQVQLLLRELIQTHRLREDDRGTS